ncbi:MAG: hypothetical protein P4L51_16735 [Puia sp.]|nr:hypothetical protein [Puia sp.]
MPLHFNFFNVLILAGCIQLVPGRNGLMMDTQFMGKFYLQQVGESLFRLKDRGDWINFIFDKHGKAIKLIYHEHSKISVSKN